MTTTLGKSSIQDALARAETRRAIGVEPPSRDEESGPRVRLPDRLKRDHAGVRIALFERLAASRLFALGDRRGVLGAAGRRSGRAFRLDVRQRVVVKARVCRHLGRGADRAGALLAHLAYLGRAGSGADGARAAVFDATRDHVAARAELASWGEDRHHFRLIVSPEHGDRIADLPAYARTVMARVAEDLGEPGLTWVGVCHYDTDQPHVHVLVRGRRADGRDLVIPRDYVGYGIRARAQEAAQERLGDLGRGEAERRVWRETQADRFTPLDRRLIGLADADGRVEDAMGEGGAWSALLRGRLLHLERLGLARHEGRRFVLSDELEPSLRRLQVGRDVIRTLNQRGLEGAKDVGVLERGRIRGVVAARGWHDEIGAAPWMVVRDGSGVEHYAPLAPGQTAPAVGRTVDVERGESLARIVAGRARGLGL